MLDFGFFYYITMCSIAILLNMFIILASTRPHIRGEFKWVFLGSATSNVLLSGAQLLLMPNVLKWPGRNEYSLIVTSNPLLQSIPQVYCAYLYDLFYFRQLEASVLSICIIPLNRAVAVCWKHVSPKSAKMWIMISVIPNFLPFLAFAISYQLGVTTLDDLSSFPEEAVLSLSERATRLSHCTLNSNYQRAGDIASTVFLATCPLISYPIAVYCVVKLFLFVRKSQTNVRSVISKQAMQRQKSILTTICIQAAAPLLIYSPLFLSILIVDNPWSLSADSETKWYEMSIVHYTVALCPAVDAAAAVLCLKPYRRAFLEQFGIPSTFVEPNLFAFTKRGSDIGQITSLSRRGSGLSIVHPDRAVKELQRNIILESVTNDQRQPSTTVLQLEENSEANMHETQV